MAAGGRFKPRARDATTDESAGSIESARNAGKACTGQAAPNDARGREEEAEGIIRYS
jgi:hypothetical protein